MRWMTRRALVGLLVTLVGAPAAVQAQEQGRFQILVPDLRATDGSNKKFGENVAKELRELFSGMLTHAPVPKKEMDSAIKEFKLNGSDLDCTTTRQLAGLRKYQLALCASYTVEGENTVVIAEFVDVGSGESFEVDPVTVGRSGEAQAAKHIFDEFEGYTAQLRAATFCVEYTASSAWAQALEHCDRALELNPESVSSRYMRSRIYWETQRAQEALADLRAVLDINPVHEDALQMAGYISATIGEDDAALGYYKRYLELSPESAPVRMKIAYELAQAGDPAGAAELIQEGLDHTPDNIDLWEQLGGFAFAAGQRLNEQAGAGGQDANTVAPEALEYFRQAIDAYTKVYEAKGADTPPHELRSIIAAYIQLGDKEMALTWGARALETHAEEAGLWSVYADALQRSGKLAEALTALERVKELDPAYPNVGLRQGKWLLEAGRITDAVAALKALATAEPAQADGAGRLVVAQAYSQGVQPKNWGVAISALEAARTIPGMGTETVHQVNFWLAYSILQGAIPEQEARTIETAQATLPRFQRARELFGQVGSYPSKVNVNLAQLLEAVNQYIEIQEIIIKRG